jgi:hypothetical protein
MTMVGLVTALPTPLLAETTTILLSAVVGVPEMVALAGSKERPAGNGNTVLRFTLGVGAPVTVKVKV